MTLSSETVKVSYSGNGATVAFPITFVFWDEDDILAVLRDDDGNETEWTNGTQYTLTGGDGSTGTLTVDTSPTDYTPATGETLVITSNRAETQETAFPLGGAFPSVNAEMAIDQTVRLIQQHGEQLDRSLKFQITDPTASIGDIPGIEDRKGKGLGFNSSTGAPEAIEFSNGSSNSVTATGSTTARTLADRAADIFNVLDYGATGDGVTNDASFLQAAIDAAHAAGGGTVFFPAGTYKHATALTFYNNTQYIGAGYECCQLSYSGTSDQVVIANPINSSTIANIFIFGIYFSGHSIVTPHGCLFDTGSSLVTVEQCYFWSGYVGLILNQSELWQIRDCYFNGSAHGAWLVNGADRSVGASQVYTNRISFDGCQFNVTSIGVVDDGGTAHSFNNCNFNAGTIWMRVAGCINLFVSGCECEGPSTAGVQFKATTLAGGSVPNWTGTATFIGNYLAGTGVESFNIAASAVRKLVLIGNQFYNTVTTFNATTNNPDELVSIGNHQSLATESNAQDASLNNYFDTIAYTPVWTASAVNPAIGNGTITGSYSRRGRDVSYQLSLTIGSTTTLGTGQWYFTAPVTPSGTAGQASVGTAYILCNSTFYPGAVVYRSPNVQVITSGAADFVGTAVPGSWQTGDTLIFTFEFVAANKIA